MLIKVLLWWQGEVGGGNICARVKSSQLKSCVSQENPAK